MCVVALALVTLALYQTRRDLRNARNEATAWRIPTNAASDRAKVTDESLRQEMADESLRQEWNRPRRVDNISLTPGVGDDGRRDAARQEMRHDPAEMFGQAATLTVMKRYRIGLALGVIALLALTGALCQSRRQRREPEAASDCMEGFSLLLWLEIDHQRRREAEARTSRRPRP